MLGGLLLEDFDGARIYFSPCGIGLGHVSRSHPVASELQKLGCEILFSTYLDGVDFILHHDIPVVSAPPISMSNDQSGSIDLKLSSVNQGVKAFPTFMAQVNTELRYMKSFKPNVVVSDSRLSSIFAAKLLGVPSILILNQFTPLIPRKRDRFMLFKVADGVVMTLIGRGWGYAEEILIPDFPPPNTLSVDSLRIPKPYQPKVRFIGAILPENSNVTMNYSMIKKRLGLGEDQNLILASISGPVAERLPLLRVLEPIFVDFPSNYMVIMSTGTPKKGSKPEMVGSLIKIPWLEDRLAYLEASDLVISRGGHETIMQSICSRKPTIIIPVPNHPEQYGNARRAQKLGVAQAIHQKYITKDSLLITVEEMLRDPSYRIKLEEMNKLSIGNGVSEVVTSVRKQLSR